MGEYSKKCLECFLEQQSKLFDQNVAETPEEAEEFLSDCMAVVLDNLEQVKEYFQEVGMDTAGLSDEEIEDAAEVFKLPDGTYLVVEG